MTIIVPPCVFCKRFPCELQRYCKYMYVTFCSAVDPDLEISKDSFKYFFCLIIRRPPRSSPRNPWNMHRS